MATDGGMLFFVFLSFEKGRDKLTAAERAANTTEKRIKQNPFIYVKTGMFCKAGATADGADEIQVSLNMQSNASSKNAWSLSSGMPYTNTG